MLDSHPPSGIIIDAAFLPHVLELIFDSNELAHHVVVVLGEPDVKTTQMASKHIKLVRWNDVEAEGKRGELLTSPAPGSSLICMKPCSTYAYLDVLEIEPDTVFTVSFFEDNAGKLQAAQLTHQNLTAGVTATRALLPLSNPMSALDTIVSAHSLSTTFGRSIAYTALHEGTSFATLASTKQYSGEGGKFSMVCGQFVSTSDFTCFTPL